MIKWAKKALAWVGSGILYVISFSLVTLFFLSIVLGWVTEIVQFVRNVAHKPSSFLEMAFDTDSIGPLGVNRAGRKFLCESVLTGGYSGRPDIKLTCDPYRNTQELVMEMKDSAPIIFGTINTDMMLEFLRRPWGEVFEEKMVVYRISPHTGRKDPPISVKDGMTKLGARTVADFLAACGFKSFMIISKNNGVKYLIVEFTNNYERNPLVHDPGVDQNPTFGQ